MSNLGTLSLTLLANSTQLTSTLRAVPGAAANAGQQSGQAFAKGMESRLSGLKQSFSNIFQGIFQGIGQQITSSLSGMFTGLMGQMKSFAASVIDVGGSFQQTEIAFTTFLKSADKAKQMMGDIQKFSASTPFELPEVTAASRSLLAFGIAQKDIIPTLRSIGDIAAGTGTSFKDLAEIYGKARTQGRLYAEDINQLTGKGIPIIDALAKQFKVNTSEVKNLVEQGKVGFPQLQKAFEDMSSKTGQFGGLMEAQSRTVKGLISTLNDQFTLLKNQLFQSLEPAITPIIGALGEIFSGLQSQSGLFDQLKKAATEFGNVFKQNPQIVQALQAAIAQILQAGLGQLVALMQNLGATLSANKNAISDFATSAASGISSAIGAIASFAAFAAKTVSFLVTFRNEIGLAIAVFAGFKTIMTVVTVFQTVSTAIGFLSTAFTVARTAMAAFNVATLAALASNPLGWVVLGTAAVAALAVVFRDDLAKAFASVGGSMAGLQAAFSGIMASLTPIFATFKEIFASAFQDLQPVFSLVFKDIQTLIQEVAKSIGSFFQEIGKIVAANKDAIASALGIIGLALAGLAKISLTVAIEGVKLLTGVLLILTKITFGALVVAIAAVTKSIEGWRLIIEVVNRVASALADLAGKAGSVLAQGFAIARTAVLSAVNSISQGISSLSSATQQFASRSGSAIASFASEARNQLVAVFSRAVQAAGNVLQNAVAFWGGVWNSARNTVSNWSSSVSATVANFFGNLSSRFQGAGAIFSSFGSLWDGLRQAATNAMQGILNVAGEMLGKVTSIFDGLVQKIQGIVQQMQSLGGLLGGTGGIGGDETPIAATGGYGGEEPRSRPYTVISTGQLRPGSRRGNPIQQRRVTSASQLLYHHDYQHSRMGPGSTMYDFTIFQNGKSRVPVPSPLSGVVEFAGVAGGYGNRVIVKDSQSGRRAGIGHLHSLDVKAGQKVKFGQSIGLQGSTGRSSGDHIHIDAHPDVVDRYIKAMVSGSYGGGIDYSQKPVNLDLLNLLSSLGVRSSSRTGTPASRTRIPSSYYGATNSGKIDYSGIEGGTGTASGERFNAMGLTAAVRNARKPNRYSHYDKSKEGIPFGSVMEVYNPKTKKSVRVRVNDIGPLVGDRGVDISYGAAKKIGYSGSGELEYRLISVPKEKQPRSSYTVTSKSGRRYNLPAPGAAATMPEMQAGAGAGYSISSTSLSTDLEDAARKAEEEKQRAIEEALNKARELINKDKDARTQLLRESSEAKKQRESFMAERAAAAAAIASASSNDPEQKALLEYQSKQVQAQADLKLKVLDLQQKRQELVIAQSAKIRLRKTGDTSDTTNYAAAIKLVNQQIEQAKNLAGSSQQLAAIERDRALIESRRSTEAAQTAQQRNIAKGEVSARRAQEDADYELSLTQTSNETLKRLLQFKRQEVEINRQIEDKQRELTNNREDLATAEGIRQADKIQSGVSSAPEIAQIDRQLSELPTLQAKQLEIVTNERRSFLEQAGKDIDASLRSLDNMTQQLESDKAPTTFAQAQTAALADTKREFDGYIVKVNEAIQATTLLGEAQAASGEDVGDTAVTLYYLEEVLKRINAEYQRRIALGKRDFELNYWQKELDTARTVEELYQQVGSAKANAMRRRGDPFDANALERDLGRRAIALDTLEQNNRIDKEGRDRGWSPETIAAMKQRVQELNQLKLDDINYQFKTLGQTILEGVAKTFTNLVGDVIKGTADMSSALDNLFNLALDMALNQLFGNIFGGLFGKGGTVGNYSSGGEVAAIPAVPRTRNPIADALKREGPNAVLAALTPGEQVLAIPEAKKYRELFPHGIPSRIPNFSAGGTVGDISLPRRAKGAGSSLWSNVNLDLTVNNNSPRPVEQQDAGNLGNKLRAAILSVLVEEQRPGGSLNN